MMNHKAIYKLYPNVVTIDDTEGATDKNGKKVTIDQKLVDAWVDPDEYKQLRKSEYPPIREQLDALYHAGAFSDEMAATIKAIKVKYPKGS